MYVVGGDVLIFGRLGSECAQFINLLIFWYKALIF